jgi:hypothetical protein
MTISDFPRHLRKPLLDLVAAGGCVARDGSRVLIDGPPALSDALRAHTEELAQHVVPSVGAATKQSLFAACWPTPAPASPTSPHPVQPARPWLKFVPALPT